MAYTMPQHFNSIEQALVSLFGNNIKIEAADQIFGGDINDAYKLTLTDGTCIFMKSNTIKNASFFSAEAAGIDAISRTGAIRTPQIFCSGTEKSGNGYSFLLMEFIEKKKCAKNYWETFAQELAAMHQAKTTDFVKGGTYGFIQDNFIGASHQKNTAHDSWISFFRSCRLTPQFNRASHYFDASGRKSITYLLDHLEDILVEPEHPSILHGDLWSGNFITGNDGKAWLIDPAVYVGHAEADLAMTELFGGFPPAFYDAYQEAAPMQPGYHHRRDLYNLYHMLNHLNLFGPYYLSLARRMIRKYT
ncbi:MAG: fructosamine kinase family protein [Roseburia sp.]|nr:fructosamine kinase family protein [Roseburia sp.]